MSDLPLHCPWCRGVLGDDAHTPGRCPHCEAWRIGVPLHAGLTLREVAEALRAAVAAGHPGGLDLRLFCGPEMGVGMCSMREGKQSTIGLALLPPEVPHG